MAIPVATIIGVGIILGGLAYWYKTRSYLSQVLIITCFLVFTVQLITSVADEFAYFEMVEFLAGKPTYLTDPLYYHTFATYMFLHGDWLHVLWNMLFLFMVGVAFEERVKSKVFGIAYFTTGIVAVVGFSFYSWGSTTSIVGASAAIAGILGAFVIMYPKERIAFILGPIFLPRIPIMLAAIIFFARDIFGIIFTPGSNIAYLAHIFGFITGIALAPLLSRYREKEDVDTINYEVLEPIASQRTDLADMLNKIMNEEEKEVRDAWLEHFLQKLPCPECTVIMKNKGRKLTCPSCGHKVKF